MWELLFIAYAACAIIYAVGGLVASIKYDFDLDVPLFIIFIIFWFAPLSAYVYSRWIK